MAANSRGPRPDVLEKRKKVVAVEEAAVSLPEGLTAAETEQWVSSDRARAQAALDAEQNREHPRSTLIASLERLIHNETGAGIATGEA